MATVVAAPEALFARVQDLQERLEQSADAATAQLAGELVSALVAMYGLGLQRIVERLRVSAAGPTLAASLAEDPVVATLLLIHDLHPVPLAERVQQALDSVRPYMESHGGDVELLEVHDGVARIHLRGSCSDCSASSVTLELAVKRALEEIAPDLEGLEVEGMAPQMGGLALPMA
ncbi:MAG TPA: NifU family protein, partial [Solirubrobacteraceae bacterium]|nr:NifU family protein [Solirubrobacteraceae bacterium]